MTNLEKWDMLGLILQEAKTYMNIIGKIEFDQQCCAPEEGREQAGEETAVIGTLLFMLTHSKEYDDLVCALYNDAEGLSEEQKALISHLNDMRLRTKGLTQDFSYEWEMARGKAYSAWLQAKQASDFSLYRNSFAELVTYAQRAVRMRSHQRETVYDSLLDDHEKGGSIEQLDAFFAALKARIVPLTREIAQRGKPIRDDFLTRPCPIPMQEAFSRQLLKLQGLRETALVFMPTEHPFTTSFGPNDVRVTTHYYEENFISNIFSTLHEGGHALFMQNEPEAFYSENIAGHMSNAMHECVARFYENFLGRSEPFIHLIYPKLCTACPDAMEGVTARELYEAVNIVRPSPIRINADELTYCLHILVRYEIEKALLNGEAEVDAVPALWNAKYKELLGIDVPNDAQGCLQDIHWTGMFGYFPSYALGNAYGAQILHTMRNAFDVDGALYEGNLTKILQWMKEHVFARASILTPDAWIREITGKPLNVEYYLTYLEEKYTKLYRL